MKYHLIKPEKIGAMCERLEKLPRIGFDVETADNGVEQGGLDPHSGELRLLQFSPDPETAYIVDVRQWRGALGRYYDSQDPLRTLLSNPNVVKVGHNLKFDAKWVKKVLGVDIENIFDTMNVDKIVEKGYKEKGHYRLDTVVERRLGIEVDKTEQRSDWGANELSDSQLTYAAKDVCVMHELMDAQLTEAERFGMMGVVVLENNIVMAMADLELNGFYLHAPAWRQVTKDAKANERRMYDTLQDTLYAGSRQLGLFGRVEIDLGSWQQMSKALLALGVPLEDGSTKEDKIAHLVDDFPVIEELLEYRGYATQVSRYGDAFLDHVHPATGRIHGDFMQIEAASGRMGSFEPNLQNIPTAKEYRNCFQAREGNKLVVADYSQIELRVLADLSEDPVMIAAFCSGADYHTATAAQVFNVPIDKVTPDQRSFAKRVNFGVVYGIGIGRLSRMTGMSYNETKAFLKKYFKTLDRMDTWLKQAAYRTEKTRQAKTMSGRIGRWAHYNPAHEDPKIGESDAGKLQRLGKNLPIQGSAADIFKRGLYLIYNDLKGSSAKLVNLVHDEYVIECSAADAPAVAERVETLARQAGQEYLTKVPCKVDTKILEEWEK